MSDDSMDGGDKENLPSDNDVDEDFNPKTSLNSSQKSQPKNRMRRPATKVQQLWLAPQEEKLITEVEKFKCLYDEGCEDNKDKFRRMDAWKIVSDSFDGKISVAQCQVKWQSLRATLRKVRKKCTETKSGQAASSVKPTWRYYDLMSFVVLAENKNRMESESNLVINVSLYLLLHQFNLFLRLI